MSVSVYAPTAILCRTAIITASSIMCMYICDTYTGKDRVSRISWTHGSHWESSKSSFAIPYT